jgi:sulfite reductase (NADPH) flavoprotein alpha-component
MNKLKKLFKQSHKILGLLFCIPIATIGVTGAILVYENELSRLEMSFLERDKQGDVLSTKEILERFIEQKPKAKLLALTYNGYDNKPLGVRASFDKENAQINDENTLNEGTFGFYSVSRYTGEMLPPLKSSKVFRAITSLHVSLDYRDNKNKLSEIGGEIVGISTILIIILSVTGLYFYIPMLKQNFFKNIKPNLTSKGYSFWYKLHSVTGVYTSIFVLIMCLTGLYWSYDWFKQGFHALIGYETKPNIQKKEKQNFPKPININEISKAFEISLQNMPKDNSFVMFIPDRTDELYKAYYKKRDYIGYGGGDNIQIDIENNKTIYHSYIKETPLKERIFSISQLHYGTFFGEIGKALWCISSLSMALFGISGVVMFYRRTNKKTKKIENQTNQTKK